MHGHVCVGGQKIQSHSLILIDHNYYRTWRMKQAAIVYQLENAPARLDVNLSASYSFKSAIVCQAATRRQRHDSMERVQQKQAQYKIAACRSDACLQAVESTRPSTSSHSTVVIVSSYKNAASPSPLPAKHAKQVIRHTQTDAELGRVSAVTSRSA